MADYGTVYKELLALQKEKKWQDSIGKADQCIALKAEAPQPHYMKGFALHNLNKSDEALKSIDKAIQLDPKYTNAHSYKGLIFKSQQKWAEAIESYDKAIENSPKDFILYFNKADCLVASKKDNEAAALYSKCTELNPDYPEAFLAEGKCLFRNKKWQPALKAFIRANELKAFTKNGELIKTLNSVHEHFESLQKHSTDKATVEKIEKKWEVAIEKSLGYIAEDKDAGKDAQTSCDEVNSEIEKAKAQHKEEKKAEDESKTPAGTSGTTAPENQKKELKPANGNQTSCCNVF